MPKHPVFDGPSYGRMLRNHMQSKDMLVMDVAERAGLSRGMIQTLRRGTPDLVYRRRGQVAINPQINTLVAVSRAIDQRLSFMLTWAGIEDEGDRFSTRERRVLAELLGCEPTEVDTALRARVNANMKEDQLSHGRSQRPDEAS